MPVTCRDIQAHVNGKHVNRIFTKIHRESTSNTASVKGLIRRRTGVRLCDSARVGPPFRRRRCGNQTALQTSLVEKERSPGSRLESRVQRRAEHVIPTTSRAALPCFGVSVRVGRAWLSHMSICTRGGGVSTVKNARVTSPHVEGRLAHGSSRRKSFYSQEAVGVCFVVRSVNTV